MQALLAAVHRFEVVSSKPESLAIRGVAGHQMQTDIVRVQSDCQAGGGPPAVP